MTTYTKIGGSWADVDSIHARVGGSWKGVTEGYTKVSGAWKQFYASIIEFPVEYLVIAGGGGGGTDSGTGAAGAGGAGGYRSSVVGELSGANSIAEDLLTLLSGTALTVSVGAGGAVLTQGGSSSFGSITSLGGGNGANNTNTLPASNGGSGGGNGRVGVASGAGTAGQGFDGGSSSSGYAAASGGGGAYGPGFSAGVAGSPPDGGLPYSSSITGTSVARAGGGGGATHQQLADSFATIGQVSGGGGLASAASSGAYGSGIYDYGNAQPGTVNTGGGGGGFAGLQVNRSGGTGGSGIVIIRYPDSLPPITTVGAGLTYNTSSSGGYRIYQFTAGSGTITF